MKTAEDSAGQRANEHRLSGRTVGVGLSSATFVSLLNKKNKTKMSEIHWIN